MIIDIQEKLADGTYVYGWKSEPPLTPVAPDYAHYMTEKKIFSEKECGEWKVYLLKQEKILLDKFRTTKGDGNTGLGFNSITSRYVHFNLLKFDFYLVPKLKKAIHDGIKTILSVSGNSNWQETLYANSWFNVLRQGESMNAHTHGYHKYTFYGFHVNINAIETITSYYHPAKFQDEAFHVPNKIGYLTLFPLFVPHEVSPNRHKTPRISIAGDIFPSTWLNETENKSVYNKNSVEIGTLLQETK